jgi:hypothetical protein
MRRIELFFMRLIGYKYVANLNSKEIHRINSKYSQCHLTEIKDRKYLREKQIPLWVQYGYNGCRFCFKEIDTDMQILCV